jgi:hypothetical protein
MRHSPAAALHDPPPGTPLLPLFSQEWAPFDAAAYDQPWSVPWGPGAVAGTMAAWVAGFLLTAFVAAPATYIKATGQAPWDLGPAGQADFALCSELLEMGVTAALLLFVVSRWVRQRGAPRDGAGRRGGRAAGGPPAWNRRRLLASCGWSIQ